MLRLELAATGIYFTSISACTRLREISMDEARLMNTSSQVCWHQCQKRHPAFPPLLASHSWPSTNAFLWAIAAVYPASSAGDEPGGGQDCFLHSHRWHNQQKCWFGCRLWSQLSGVCRQTRRVSTAFQKCKLLACVFGWYTVELGECYILPLRNR